MDAAVRFGKDFVSGAIRNSLRIGEGFGPVNPGWQLDQWSRARGPKKPPPAH